MLFKIKILLLFFFCSVIETRAQYIQVNESFHLYLLIGQSNMAGRGSVESLDTITNHRLLCLNKNGEWVLAKEPIGFDKAWSGVGPSLSFGREMAKADTSVVIGLIPCAQGGSSIESWVKGAFWHEVDEYPFDFAIKQAKTAMKAGVLKGIIWQQGESDCIEGNAQEYQKKLEALIKAFRKEFDAPELPFVVGELPIFNTDAPDFQFRLIINDAFHSCKETVRNYAVISAESTFHKGDNLHFDSPSARLMGKRFAIAMKQLHGKNWQIGPFVKPDINPVLESDSNYTFVCPVQNKTVRWQMADVFNPAAIVRNDTVFVLARCEDNKHAGLGQRTSRIGLSYSTDGIHFNTMPEPVLYPDSSEFIQYDYPGGCEDPRLVETVDGLYVMAYTSWNYDVPRLSIAFSNDLVRWEKKGPAFALAHEGKFLNKASKSGSIISKFINGKLYAAKINGKYWMYWGEHIVNLAWSENLYDWHPLLNDDGSLKALISPRNGKFDSDLTECGPPAILRDDGVLLIYNGKNSNTDNADNTLPKGTYSMGQVLFDASDMQTVICRTDTCLLKPTLPHEITGQYMAGTVFSEGLVFFKNKWYLYYGTADSYVGLAVSRSLKQ